MTPFELYRRYIALKLHFTTDSYDIVKTKGAVKITESAFRGKNVEKIINHFSKKYSKNEATNLFVSNFVVGDKYGGLYSTMSKEIYDDWVHRMHQLKYVFKTVLDDIYNHAEADGIENPFEINDGQHPYFIRCYLAKFTSLETLTIINKINPFVEKLDTALQNDIIWPDVRRLIIKYTPFIKIKSERDEYEKIYWQRVGRT